MLDFTEEHATFLLNKEWLVKVDNERSTPYLFKFYYSTVDLSCCLMITDTKSVWAEVISGKQFARRWRACNRASDSEFPDPEHEDSWRTMKLELLSKAHTLGPMTDTSFQVVESDYSDFAFQLECGVFEWRWETNNLGHMRSSEIISKHLIFPLITMGSIALSSSESLGEMSDVDVEKAVDRVGRTARRTVDTHVKNALSKPRMATTIRRISSMFNFASELPAVFSTADTPSLDLEAWSEPCRPQTPNRHPVMSPKLVPSPPQQPREPETKGSHNTLTDSATESESDACPKKSRSPVAVERNRSPLLRSHDSRKGSSAHLSRNPSSVVLDSAVPAAAASSESEISPVRPVKKLKGPVSTDEDSETERRKHLQQLKSGTTPSAAKRSVRQPIKRGGKRF